MDEYEMILELFNILFPGKKVESTQQAYEQIKEKIDEFKK
jgi:hypothetical protein